MAQKKNELVQGTRSDYLRRFGGPGDCDMMALAMAMGEEFRDHEARVYVLEKGSTSVRVYNTVHTPGTSDLRAVNPRPNDVVMEVGVDGGYASWVGGGGAPRCQIASPREVPMERESGGGVNSFKY